MIQLAGHDFCCIMYFVFGILIENVKFEHAFSPGPTTKQNLATCSKGEM